MPAFRLSCFTMTSCLGAGVTPSLAALREQRSGIVRKHWETVEFAPCIGEVSGLEDFALRPELHAQGFDCRNNRLAQLALEQDDFAGHIRAARARYGATRIGVLLGTSTSGILQTEIAFRHRDPITGALPAGLDYQHAHNTYSVADFTRQYFDLAGPALVISTACSSSAKAFGSAARMIEAGLIDAAIVGGVDSLCLTTLYGFNSLQLVSPEPCKPFDAHRDGLSIGEAAAFILLERCTSPAAGDILLAGVGESSDAHHMSSPHPEGLGAQRAMQGALDMAGLRPADIDYLNLHGTATPSNDAAEDKGVCAVFGTTTACSSTKGHTGHTLGAAGGVEAVISALALQHGLAPGGVGTTELDPRLHSHYLLHNQERPLRHVLSNSFGFGGTNCSLLFSRVTA